MADHGFEFDFVISYASEDKEYAKQLYESLAGRGIKVFYAPEFTAEIWGEVLYEYLSDVYSKKGLFCIPLVSNAYVQKQWTRHEWRSAQERALKETRRAYILPIRLDDTPLPGLLETTAYLDSKSHSIESIATMAHRKLKLQDSGVVLERPTAEQIAEVQPAWQLVSQAFQRSAFLTENNYLNRRSDHFASHQWTQNLLDLDNPEQSASAFVSFVSIPIPEPVTLDLEEIEGFFSFDQSPYGVQSGEQSAPEYWFPTIGLTGSRHTQSESIRVAPWSRAQYSKYVWFLRWTETGALEFGVSNPAVRVIDHPIGGQGTKIFHFVYILGTAWKFINLAASVYSRLGYQGQFQFLLNLKNTSNAVIAEFASSRNTRWPSLLNQHPGVAYEMATQGTGRAIDLNIQLVFTISVESLTSAPSLSAEMMQEMSRKIQRCFNHNIEARHFIRNTTEFPWQQYSEASQPFS